MFFLLFISYINLSASLPGVRSVYKSKREQGIRHCKQQLDTDSCCVAAISDRKFDMYFLNSDVISALNAEHVRPKESNTSKAFIDPNRLAEIMHEFGGIRPVQSINTRCSKWIGADHKERHTCKFDCQDTRDLERPIELGYSGDFLGRILNGTVRKSLLRRKHTRFTTGFKLFCPVSWKAVIVRKRSQWASDPDTEKRRTGICSPEGRDPGVQALEDAVDSSDQESRAAELDSDAKDSPHDLRANEDSEQVVPVLPNESDGGIQVHSELTTPEVVDVDNSEYFACASLWKPGSLDASGLF